MAPKQCTLCHTPRQILVRCQTDASAKWHFVCPGACWRSVSGGVEDAKGLEGMYPFYRYGGMWKDRDVDGPVSARKPRRVKERQKREREGRGGVSQDEDGDGDGGSGGSEDEGQTQTQTQTQGQDPKDGSKAGESVLD